MSGAKIREFFRELFGSRLIDHLESEIIQIRSDCEMRLRDKDDVITQLRAEKAVLDMKVIQYENELLAKNSRAGAAVVAAREGKPTKPSWAADPAAFVSQLPKSRWEQYQDDYYKEQDRLEAEEKQKAAAATAKEN